MGQIYFVDTCNTTIDDHDMLTITQLAIPCDSKYTTLNIELRVKDHRLARRCKRAYKTWGYWTKIHQIFLSDVGVIGGVNACINVAFLQSVLECQCTD